MPLFRGRRGREAPARKGFFARFRRSSDGTAALEFALVSVPFFAILFAIIETALVFFVGQILDNAVTRASRQIRTGQAHQSGTMSETTFKTTVCNAMVTINNCTSNLYVDVRPYDGFDDADLEAPIDEDGNVTGTIFDIGETSDIIVVRAYYAWPVFFRMFSTTGTQLADGRRLLSSIVAFRNEPFPW